MPVLETERVSSGDLFGGEALGARALDAAARGALRGRLLRRLHRAVRAALGAADPTVASWATDWLLAQDVDACYRLGPRGPEVRTADGEWLTAAEVEERLHRARNLVQAVDRLGVVEQIRRDAERSAVAAIFYRRLAATSLGPDGAGPLTIPAPSEAELAHARERLPAVWAAVRAACARRGWPVLPPEQPPEVRPLTVADRMRAGAVGCALLGLHVERAPLAIHVASADVYVLAHECVHAALSATGLRGLVVANDDEEEALASAIAAEVVEEGRPT